jgi:hypothetical protein
MGSGIAALVVDRRFCVIDENLPNIPIFRAFFNARIAAFIGLGNANAFAATKCAQKQAVNSTEPLTFASFGLTGPFCNRMFVSKRGG